MSAITLTPAQEALLDQRYKEWLAYGYSCAPADFPAADAAITRLYALINLPAPKIIHVPSIYAAEVKANELFNPNYRPGEALSPIFLNNRWASQHWTSLEAHYFFLREINVDVGEEFLDPLTQWAILAKSICWWAAWEGIAIVSDRAEELHVDAQGNLHCETGPAIKFRNGWAIYNWHGVQIPSQWIEDRASITIRQIQAEGNIELRRVLMDLYGRNRYLLDAGAKPIAEDRFGKLWSMKEPGSNEPLVYVQVWNSTEEPQFAESDIFKAWWTKHYPGQPSRPRREFWLRVPPGTKTSHEAVAWTFGKTSKTYNPSHEA